MANELFQYSIVSALMDGVASTGISITKLLSHGNHGLGTFRHMVGEMIILDGKVYQMKSDGSVSTVESTDDSVAPFAMVTEYEPTTTRRADLKSKDALFNLISTMLPETKNHYVAIRLDGVFKSMTVRTVGGQQAPRESLAEVGKRQVSHTFNEPTQGTIIGFRSPEYMQGISVAGDHLHFISKDRKRGGHILALETDGEVEISAAALFRVHLELPSQDAEFNDAAWKGDSAGITAVEG